MSAPAKEPQKKRVKSSLSRKTAILILVMALLPGLTAVIIGYRLYSENLEARYAESTLALARTAAKILDKEAAEKYAAEVFEIYSSLTPEEMADEDEAYLEKYAFMMEEKGWQFLREQLQDISKENDLASVVLLVADEKTKTVIYVVDSDTSETFCQPGTMDMTLTDEEIQLFRNGKPVITNTEEFGWLSSCASVVYNAEGKVIGYTIAEISVNEVMGKKHDFLYIFGIALVLADALVGIVTTWFMRRKVVEPINKLAKAADEYSRDQGAPEEQGGTPSNHFKELGIRTGDEVEHLADVMGEMESRLADYIDFITRETAEKERIGTELNIARRIQASMLPQTFPPYPDRKEFDLYASMDPAREVGGDFYDFFLVDDDHLCLVIADVSGKGVPAALFMMSSKEMIANKAMEGKSPGQVLEETNEILCASGQEDMFVTVWIGILEISTGKLTASNGGHEYPVLMQDGSFMLHKDVHSFLVGGMPEKKYKEYVIQMKPGDRLFVYTDGVPEAHRPGEPLFGIQRTVDVLNERKDESPESMLKAVKKAVDDYVGDDAEQFDDMTMLCMEYKGIQ